MADNLIPIKELNPIGENLKGSAELPITQEGVTYKTSVNELEYRNRNELRKEFATKTELEETNTEVSNKIDKSEKGVTVATLDNEGKLSESQRPIVEINSSIQPIDLSTETPTENGVFEPLEVGVYPNFGNLELTQQEKDSSIVYFYLLNGVFSKQVKTVQTSDIIESNSTNAVSSRGVYNWSVRNVKNIAELRTIQGVEGQEINLLGYYEAGDKDPLLYKWVLGEAEDDGGSVIVSSGGYWKALYHTTELDYGAKDVLIFNGYEEISTYNSTEGKLVEFKGKIYYYYRRTKKGYHNNNEGNIYCKISVDNGKTFGAESLVISNTRDVRNFVVGVTDNIISIIYRVIDTDNNNSHIGVFTNFSADGTTFSNEIELNRDGSESVVPFGKILKRQDGYYFLMYARQNPNSTCHLFKSNDGKNWQLNNTVYSLNDGNIFSEPVLEDFKGGSIIIVRNSNQNIRTNFFQLTSTDGINFSNPKATNISNEYNYADTPCWIDCTENGNIIVYSNGRIGSINEVNLVSKFHIYKSKITDILENPLNHKKYYDIDRPYINSTSIYGYPATVKTSFGYLGVITERRLVDDTTISLSSTYNNEADNCYLFSMLNYGVDENNIGSDLMINKYNNLNYYFKNDNYVIGYEDKLNKLIFKTNVKDPQNSGVNGSTGKIVSLQSFNNEDNINYPQSAKGGMIILAQSSVGGVSWMLGRGNSNDNQGTLFINTFNTTTKQWSGWKEILNIENGAVKIASNTDWNTINRSGFLVNASATNSPDGTSYHGCYFPQGTTGANGTYLVFRQNKAYIRSVNSNVIMDYTELLTTESNLLKNIENRLKALEDK